MSTTEIPSFAKCKERPLMVMDMADWDQRVSDSGDGAPASAAAVGRGGALATALISQGSHRQADEQRADDGIR